MTSSDRPSRPPAAPPSWTGMGFGLLLTAVIAVEYYGFLLLGAFEPHWLAQPALRHVPWSFLLGALLLASAVALTGLYAWHANAAEDAR